MTEKKTRRAMVRQLAAGIGGAIGLLAAFQSVARADDEADPTEDPTEETPDVTDIALGQLGKIYIWGSAAGRSYFGPDPRGFDCSGFVAWAMRQVGAVVPASTSSAWRATVPTDDPQPGDLAFFNMSYASPYLQHVALYLGDGRIVQCGGRRNYVNIDSAWAIGRPTFRRLPS